MLNLIQFLFILSIPVVLVLGVPVGLFALGAVLDIVDHPDELKGRVEGFFRSPLAPPRTPGKDHYYRAYWADK